MGTSQSRPLLPRQFEPIESEDASEIVIQLKDAREIYKLCTYLHQTGVNIMATNECNNGKCFVWLQKSPEISSNLSECYCGTFQLEPLNNPKSKGTHRLSFSNCTYADLIEHRKHYESMYPVSAQSPVTQLGVKHLYFDFSAKQ